MDITAPAPKPTASMLLNGTLLFAGFALIALMFGSTIAETLRICWESDDYSHGLLLPLISGYFLWTDRAVIAPIVRGQIIRGGIGEGNSKNTTAFSNILTYSGSLLLFCLGLATYVIGRVSDLHFILWFSLFPTVVAFLCLALSPQRATPLILPIILNYMAKPIPDALVPKLFFPLQVLAAKISAFLLELLNVPVFLRGNIIEVPGIQLMVEEACSGLRSMMALLTVAVVVIYTVRLPILGKLLLIVISALVAVVLNVIRVAATGILAHFVDPVMATGFFHTFSGLVVFVVGLICLSLVAKALQIVFKTAPVSTDRGGQK